MSDNGKASPCLPTLIGAFVVGSLSAAAGVGAAENPFVSTPLAHGYMLSQSDATSQDKGGDSEGKCGGHKTVEGSCGGAR